MKNKYFPLPLIVRHINGRMWELIEPFEYHPDKGKIIKIPPNFLFDFASMPKVLWSFIGHPAGRYGPAALLHDYLYATQTLTRWKSDKIFLDAMKILKVPLWKRQVMFWGVRVGGFIAWKEN